MRGFIIGTVAVSLFLPLACRHAETDPSLDPSQGPSSVARVYVLRTVAGEALPAVLLDNEHATIVSLADTIWLEADGSGVEVATERSTDKGSGMEPIVRRDERPFTYRLERDRIEIDFECNDVIIRSCVAPPHLLGALTEARLSFYYALYPRLPLEYERIH